MHICQIIPKLHAGGAEVGCMALAKALVKLGHQASIVTSGGRYVAPCKQAGVDIIELPVHQKSPWALHQNTKKIRDITQAINADLVHVRSRAPAWSTYHALKRSTTPWITTYHGAYKQSNRLKYQYNRVMTLGRKIIAPSEFMHQHILHHYPECKDKIITISRGIDLCAYQTVPNQDQISAFREQCDIKPHEKIILLPGRLTALKGHFLCLKALQKIAPKLRKKSYKILFLGDNSKRDYTTHIIKTIQSLDLEDLVSMKPHCDTMPIAYHAANITLNTSLQPESFGRTIVEAQAARSLIIASGHGGATENIRHGYSGLLFTPNCIDSLAVCLEEAMALEPEEHAMIIDNACKWANQHANEATMIDKTIQLYHAMETSTQVS